MEQEPDQIVDGDESSKAETIAESTDSPTVMAVKTRLDPRTGKQVAMQPASFWREHDERRLGRGQSITQYSEEQGLALSTFRRWSSRFAGERSAAGPVMASGDSAFLSVPIRTSESGLTAAALPVAAIEVQMRSGVRVSLRGAPADRAIEAVMAELVGVR